MGKFSPLFPHKERKKMNPSRSKSPILSLKNKTKLKLSNSFSYQPRKSKSEEKYSNDLYINFVKSKLQTYNAEYIDYLYKIHAEENYEFLKAIWVYQQIKSPEARAHEALYILNKFKSVLNIDNCYISEVDDTITINECGVDIFDNMEREICKLLYDNYKLK